MDSAGGGMFKKRSLSVRAYFACLDCVQIPTALVNKLLMVTDYTQRSQGYVIG